MKYPFECEAPAELVARAERERREAPGQKVRPFVFELADRGDITPEEWGVPMNSYERHLLEPLLRTDLLAGHLDYCAANCQPCLSNVSHPVTYDEALSVVLAPAAARRLRMLDARATGLERFLASKGETSFGVEVCDDHDGGSVWMVEEDLIDDRGDAEALAAKRSKSRDNERARVTVVTRRVVAEFRRGEQTELGEGHSRHVYFTLKEFVDEEDLPRPSQGDLSRWKELARQRERPPPRVLAILVQEVERLRKTYEPPFNWRGVVRTTEPSAELLELTGPGREKVET